MGRPSTLQASVAVLLALAAGEGSAALQARAPVPVVRARMEAFLGRGLDAGGDWASSPLTPQTRLRIADRARDFIQDHVLFLQSDEGERRAARAEAALEAAALSAILEAHPDFSRISAAGKRVLAERAVELGESLPPETREAVAAEMRRLAQAWGEREAEALPGTAVVAPGGGRRPAPLRKAGAAASPGAPADVYRNPKAALEAYYRAAARHSREHPESLGLDAPRQDLTGEFETMRRELVRFRLGVDAGVRARMGALADRIAAMPGGVPTVRDGLVLPTRFALLQSQRLEPGRSREYELGMMADTIARFMSDQLWRYTAYDKSSFPAELARFLGDESLAQVVLRLPKRREQSLRRRQRGLILDPLEAEALTRGILESDNFLLFYLAAWSEFQDFRGELSGPDRKPVDPEFDVRWRRPRDLFETILGDYLSPRLDHQWPFLPAFTQPTHLEILKVFGRYMPLSLAAEERFVDGQKMDPFRLLLHDLEIHGAAIRDVHSWRDRRLRPLLADFDAKLDAVVARVRSAGLDRRRQAAVLTLLFEHRWERAGLAFPTGSHLEAVMEGVLERIRRNFYGKMRTLDGASFDTRGLTRADLDAAAEFIAPSLHSQLVR